MEPSANSEELQVGEIIKAPFACAIISWKIPNVTSLLNPEYNSVQSPLFSFKNAIWNFKMNPHPNEMGGLEVVMERLHSQISVHNIFYKCFFKSHSWVLSSGINSQTFVFDSSPEKKSVAMRWTTGILDFYKTHRYGDTLTFLCEVYSKKNPEIEIDFDQNFFTGYLSKYFFCF